MNPDIIEEEITKYLVGQKIQPNVNEKKYKIKFEFEAPIEGLEKNYKVKICIRILQADNDHVAIEFNKLDGP